MVWGAPSPGSGTWRGCLPLSLHALRHSYVTHLIEAGYDPLFVQQQVGHAYSSTTALYTSVSADYKQKIVQAMIARRLRTGDDNE